MDTAARFQQRGMPTSSGKSFHRNSGCIKQTNRSTPNKFCGTPLGEWLEGKPDELDIDAVPLDFISGLRTEFGLSGDDLDQAVRELLEKLMARGARPIQGHSDDGGYWTRVTRFGDEPSQIVEGVIREWHASGRDPEIGDIWFALPEYIEAQIRGREARRLLQRTDQDSIPGAMKGTD